MGIRRSRAATRPEREGGPNAELALPGGPGGQGAEVGVHFQSHRLGTRQQSIQVVQGRLLGKFVVVALLAQQADQSFELGLGPTAVPPSAPAGSFEIIPAMTAGTRVRPVMSLAPGTFRTKDPPARAQDERGYGWKGDGMNGLAAVVDGSGATRDPLRTVADLARDVAAEVLAVDRSCSGEVA